MRIFVAGATGVIGRSLVRLLIYKGHVVTAMTRSLNRAEWLASLGAQPVTCDIYDARGLQEAVQRAQPDAVVHELTSLPQAINPRRIRQQVVFDGFFLEPHTPMSSSRTWEPQNC